MNYQETLNYLYHLGNEVLSANFKLGRVQRLLNELEDPQLAYPSLIIAGTNGKGSVTSMIDSIMRQAGFHTGMYTSPHLVSVCERIQVAGKEISSEAFAEHATRVKEAGQRLVGRGELSSMPTFFEHVTATAFSYFHQQQIDAAILEVGLGGRLDATNTARSHMAVITQIDFDHEKVLGSTLEEISAEKAAVIKPEMSVVIGPQRSDVMSVLQHQCQECGVTPRVTPSDSIQIREVSDQGRYTFDYRSQSHFYENIRLPLCGYHQIENAIIAIESAEVLRQLGGPITEQHILDGLQTVVWPGRLEWIDHRPAMLLDGAHNPAATQALRRFLKDFARQPLTVVFGVMHDKRIETMSALLFPLAQHVILTRVQDERSATLSSLYERVAGHDKLYLEESVEAALQKAIALTPPEGMICVAGSLHLIGAVKEHWGTSLTGMAGD